MAEGVAEALVGVRGDAAFACHAVVERILRAPDEPRFRRINTRSRAFLSRMREATAVLEALGFAEAADAPGCLVAAPAGDAVLRAAAPLLRAAADAPVPVHAAAPPQALPDDVLRSSVAPCLAGAKPWRPEETGSIPLAFLDVAPLDAVCRSWRRALAPLWQGRRLLACRRLGARRVLATNWRHFENFATKYLRGNLNNPCGLRGVAGAERTLGAALPLSYRLSVLHHHDGQAGGWFYNGARLLTVDEAVAEAAHAPAGWLPVCERKGASQVAIDRKTGEVAILVGTTVGKRLGRSWAAFLKLV